MLDGLWPGFLGRVSTAVVYGIAGACLFLALYNRRFLFLRRIWLKRGLVLLTLIVTVLLPTVGGWWTGVSWWLSAPLLILAAAGVAELVRMHTRRRHRGLPTPRHTRLRRPITTTDLDVIHYDWSCRGWTGPPFTMVHISDLHAGRGLPRAYIDSLHARVAAEEPDVILMTGDFVTFADDIPRLPDVLAPLRARHGCFGVLGNHDIWVGGDTVATAVSACGVTLVGNRAERVAIDADHHVMLAGCEAPWSDTPWEPPDHGDDPLLVLTHTADNVYRIKDAGAVAAFAGHYHGGQFLLPGLGPIVLPSALGRRFPHGHYIIDGTDLFISAGVGVARPPFRLYCPPDILVISVTQGNKQHGY